jgi:DNA-binding NtrC family response regulator
MRYIAMMLREVERVLVVEDSPQLSRSLCAILAETYREVRACGSVAAVAAELADWWPDLVLLDVVLPDGDAHDVLALFARRQPAPAVIAMSGAAGPAQSFALAAHGVRAFLDKPLRIERVRAAIEQALAVTPALGPALRQTVGHRSLAEVETEVRAVMIDEALARVGGSRRGAARLLEMSRQLLQYALRRDR